MAALHSGTSSDESHGEQVLSAIADGSKSSSRVLGPKGLGGLKWLSGLIALLVLVIVLLLIVAG